ncbi:TPA: hypothetical protein [Aquificae Joseph's Coat Spring virus]|nr:TPA: hypothetical protein [Aquificae Joseph's Coat Spring virus]
MLNKAIVKSLKDSYFSNGVELYDLDFALKDVKAYLAYSMKFELHRSKFKEHLKEFLNAGFGLSEELKAEALEVGYQWYVYYLENKSLTKPTSSLKSDMKKVYKKYKGTLDNFDRFMELVNNAFKEACNIYTVIMYHTNAIKYNDNFNDDRNSCYINGRKSYLKALSQSKTFYTMIYKNGQPITRVWFMVDEYWEGSCVFNRYGFKFKNLAKFFYDEDEFYYGDYTYLEEAVGVYINNDDILISKNLGYEDFIYEVSCPSCGCLITSDTLKWEDNHGLVCDECDGRVYSELYQDYIAEEDAYYSSVYESYIYYDDSVYSNFYDDRILRDDKQRVYNMDIDDYDFVLKDDSVYSEYYDMYLIKEQTVFSDYYQTYLLKDSNNMVFSKWLDSYIDIEDANIIIINDDYIPLEDIQEYIERNNIKHLKTV